MRLSRHLQFRYLQPGVVGVYSPFGHEVAFVDARYWVALEAGSLSAVPGTVVDDLVRRGFLVAEGADPRLLQAFSAPPASLSELWLVLTGDCNLACGYCVVEGNIKEKNEPTGCRDVDSSGHSSLMSPSTAQAAVRRFFDHCYVHGVRPARVVLYGGEPLLNRAVVHSVVPLLRKMEAKLFAGSQPIQVLIITNGVIYDEATTALLKSYSVSVSVSIDGMKHHHDMARRTRGGAPTFDKAVAALRSYQSAGLNTGICATIGTHNVNDLPAIADFFAGQFGVPMQFQVPYDIPGSNPFYVTMMEAGPKTLEAYDRLRQRGLVEGLTDRRVSMFYKGVFHYRDCSAVGGQWVISPEGLIGPCHSLVGDPRYFAGNINDPDCSPATLPVVQEWSRRMPVNMPQCFWCPAVSLCGGGCPYNALVRSGSIWEKDPQQCEYMRMLIDWLIADVWRQYAANGASRQETLSPPAGRALRVAGSGTGDFDERHTGGVRAP